MRLFEFLWLLRRFHARRRVWWYVGEEDGPLTGDEVF